MKIQISISGTDLLFHYTSMYNANLMLATNKLRLSSVGGTQSDSVLNKGYMYYFSTARSVHGNYNKMSANSVQLVLDGYKLGHKYKIVAVDYWGEDFRKHKKGAYEMEDRLLSNKPEIPNAKRYIKEIHLLLDEKPNVRANSMARKFVMLAKKLNIPIYLYRDKKAAQLLDKRNSLSLEEVNLEGSERERYFYRHAMKAGKGLLELIYNDSSAVDKLTKDGLNWLRRSRPHRKDDFVIQLNNMIHNSKAMPDKTVSSLVEYMRKNKLDSAGMFEFISEKWKDTPVSSF